MNADPKSLVNAIKIEKILLAKQVGQFLSRDQVDEERVAVENVARLLAGDISEKVRRVLAFELRHCNVLVPDLAEKIARDIKSVAVPFLSVTKAISDKTYLRLLPQLEDWAKAAVARRIDLSSLVSQALARMGDEHSVTTLVRNDSLQLSNKIVGIVVDRFGKNVRIMDHLSARSDLRAEAVDRLLDKVSHHCREPMLDKLETSDVSPDFEVYNFQLEALWEQLEEASEAQVHACVTELRNARHLNHLLAIEMAKKGCKAFLESTLALEAGLPIGEIKDILTLQDRGAFVRLMQMASVSNSDAPHFLQLAKAQHSTEKYAA